MAALLWKVNLPAGRISGVGEFGTYLVQQDETKSYWTVEYTDFPTDAVMRPVPPCPKGRFASWDIACVACAKHANARAEAPVLMRA